VSVVPSSVLAGLAASCAAFALLAGARAGLARGIDRHVFAAGAGAFAVAVLFALDGGRLLRWDYGIGAGSGRHEMPDAALVLALGLLAALGGTLALAADRLGTPDTPAAGASGSLARTLGRRSLLAAWGLLVPGTGLVLLRSPKEALLAAPRGPVALAMTVIGLGLALWPTVGEPRPIEAGTTEAQAAVATRLAAVLATTALLTAGVEGWMSGGTYLTISSLRLSAASLAGLSALPETGLPNARRALLLVSLLAAAIGG
jgi:hypothetical protein